MSTQPPCSHGRRLDTLDVNKGCADLGRLCPRILPSAVREAKDREKLVRNKPSVSKQSGTRTW